MSRETWSAFLDRLCRRLRQMAGTVATSALYGSENVDLGVWCEECAPDDAWNLNGGGGTNEDSQCFCEKCGLILDHCLTDWGTRNEVQRMADEVGPLHPEEAFTLLNCIDTGFPKLTGNCGDWECMPELKPAIRSIAKRLGMRPPTINKESA